ncbi:MAG TPA: hypothetical protein ENG87_03895 [Candidatus Pacearchaeota archaeon]|nr:hypothetical protein [Candidatus Pacearchaeota archaeon]
MKKETLKDRVEHTEDLGYPIDFIELDYVKKFIKDILGEIEKSKYSSEARWDIYLKNKIKQNSGFEDLE